jgi:hypothetical protein
MFCSTRQLAPMILGFEDLLAATAPAGDPGDAFDDREKHRSREAEQNKAIERLDDAHHLPMGFKI